MKKVRTTLLWIITAAICAYIAWGITVELFPQPQFTVELAEAQNQAVTVYTYHDQGTPFPATLTGPDTYVCDIPQGYWKNAYHLEFTVDPANNRVLSASINGETVNPRHIVQVAEFNSSSPYCSTVVITTGEAAIKSLIMFCAVLAVLLALCLIVRREIKSSGYGNIGKAILCGGSALKYIGKSTLLFAVIAIMLSCLIAVGCDIDTIIGTMNLYGSGVNIYQYQATIDLRYQIVMPLWPYNLPLTMFYFLGTLPLSLCRSLYSCGTYHIFHYLIYKLLNGMLLAAVVIGILSFLEKRGYIAGKKCRSVFLWSFFNPVVFYVAVVFLQADPFPMCCLALGCLLLADKQTPVLSGILLGTGLACKMQNLLMLPMVLVLMLFLLLKKQPGPTRAAALKTALVTAFILAVWMMPNLKPNAPLAVMFQYLPLSERVWWTAIQYTPTVFLQFTPGILILIMIADLLRVHLGASDEAMTMNALYMFGAIVLLYSFSMLSTPSTYIHTLAAFTLCNVFAKDRFQRLLIAGLSALIVFEVMFTSVGDVLRLTNMFGLTTSFAAIEQAVQAAGGGVKFGSLLFTISHAAMLAFGLYFYRSAVRSIAPVESLDTTLTL